MARKRTGKRIEVDGGYRVAGKAANGEGTVFYDKSINAWRVRWVDINGRRRSTSGPTRDAALARRDERDAGIVAAKNVGTALGDDPTVADLAAHWLESFSATIGPGTRKAYANDLKRITDHIGGLPLADLDRPAVQKFVNSLAEDYHANTIRGTRTRLAMICREGIELGVLDKVPTAHIRVPKDPPAKRTQKRYLTLDEQHLLLATLDARYRWDAGVAILFTCGSRASEVVGLGEDDLDLDNGTARIRRGATYLGADGDHIDTAKTAETHGIIRLPPVTVDLLRAHLDRRAREDPHRSPLIYEGVELRPVFRSETGRIGRRTDLHRATLRALQRAKIDTDRVGTHTGRRTVITLLYQAGVPLEDIAQFVGHADVATTAGYVVDLGERPAAVAARAAELFDPGQSSSTG